jgi:transcriptional regulator with XRE-family HTH domain
MMRSAKIIARYLAQTGWSQSELARRANVNPSSICRAVQGHPVGRLVAAQIEQATRDAYVRGEVDVEPLARERLSPAFRGRRAA